MTDLNIDPCIKIELVADGEVHIVFAWGLDELEQFARAYLKASESMKAGASASSVNFGLSVFRIRTKEGMDYLIDELQQARRQLYGD